MGNGPVLSPVLGSWNSLRVLSPDAIELPDGSLVMAACGQANAGSGVPAGSIGFWRSP
ncbi:MAG: hypothetical protein HOP12_05290 [Candidatus Eisenbacteria bacterium]|uniref:Lipocalin-like domain-containing protein n=1 Tax=Eiseniibacteriota bacterium TaxID=2212470 RepID=A0A849SQ94_UNCEI|nr:hypothetical protein [Candidatus Eisenbacteria bacterium]